ncbi:MAG: 3-hydroxybutyryl-CoA dehydrogenase [Candidatus Eremiobacteraeota bacterium]|nr:3-hydroxybutyryl-CoA dehydrogenase [Candidatus Eremiobacteraeota bacterium]
MGAGIAQVAAQAGDEVLLHDVEQRFIDRGFRTIEKNLDRAVEKGRMSEEQRGKVLAHVDARPRWDDFDVDVAIEAATENLEIKLDLFRRMDENTPPTSVLASNTSSISITRLGAVTSRAERVIGMHFFNPVPVMRLVELIRGLATSQQTFETARELAVRYGKTPVAANDFPGFISNRILCPMLNEAVYALYEGVGTVDAIDAVMKLGMNHPMGPLELADFVGLDTLLAIMDVLYEGYSDSKYRACPLLRKYVAAGWLGRKSGRGFYDWSGGTIKAAAPPDGATQTVAAAAR